MRVSFHRVFSAAHRVWNDDGKCSNIHGHNYQVAVEIDAEELNEQGFVVPFDRVKDVIDQYDHTLILDVEDKLHPQLTALGVKVTPVHVVPSTENMAQLIANEIARGVEGTVRVSLRETEGILAVAVASSRIAGA